MKLISLGRFPITLAETLEIRGRKIDELISGRYFFGIQETFDIMMKYILGMASMQPFCKLLCIN